jgi:phosphatidylserine/phosphatidylglycerophosphate/cardiolipin synthase-like enzyme
MMTKKKTRKSKTKRKRSTKSRSQNRTITLIITAVVVILGGYYLLTGSDPLGLFKQVEETPPPAVVGSGGDWWQVYFTDPQNVNDPDNLAGSIPEKLIGHINQAQDTIHIASFEFNLTPVAEALIDAHNRGVEVKWVTDDEHGIESDEEDDHGQFAMLEKAGIEIKDDERGALMHNKFWIFDNKTVWTGSTNITANGNFRNNNNVLVIDSSEVAAIYEREFVEMWNGEFGPTSTSTVQDQRTVIDGTSVQVLFAAEDEVATQLIPLIENAQNSIRFMAFSFTHDGIGEAVLARAKAGVDTQGIFETRGSETEYSELTALYCAKVPVRQDGNPGTFHHKVFIIDEQLVATGSLNFSDNADESNDENVVVVTNRDIATQYLQEFERRWAEATDPDAKDLSCK